MHPIKEGTKTNVGTILSYKYVRFGIGKYRYYVKENENGYWQDKVFIINQSNNN